MTKVFKIRIATCGMKLCNRSPKEVVAKKSMEKTPWHNPLPGQFKPPKAGVLFLFIAPWVMGLWNFGELCGILFKNVETVENLGM